MKRGFGLHVGSSSILVVFVLLCLTTFATLSMVSANADYRLSEQSAEAASRYYRADELAEELLREVGVTLENCLVLASSPEGYRVLVQSRLAEWAQETRLPVEDWGLDGASAALDYTLTADSLRFQVPIDENQALAVALSLADYPGPGGVGERPLLTRTGWKVVSAQEQDYETLDSGVEFWDGGDLSFLLQ